MENVVQFFVSIDFCQHFFGLGASKFVELAIKVS